MFIQPRFTWVCLKIGNPHISWFLITFPLKQAIPGHTVYSIVGRSMIYSNYHFRCFNLHLFGQRNNVNIVRGFLRHPTIFNPKLSSGSGKSPVLLGKSSEGVSIPRFESRRVVSEFPVAFFHWYSRMFIHTDSHSYSIYIVYIYIYSIILYHGSIPLVYIWQWVKTLYPWWTSK